MNQKKSKLLNKAAKEMGLNPKEVKRVHGTLTDKEKEGWKKEIEERLAKHREWKKQAKAGFAELEYKSEAPVSKDDPTGPVYVLRKKGLRKAGKKLMKENDTTGLPVTTH